MIAELPAGLILVAAGIAVPFLPRAVRGPVAAVAPLLALAQLVWLGPGHVVQAQVLGFDLTLVRTDRLSLAFGYVFTIAAFLNAIFSWRVRDGIEPPAALIYAGTALGAIFAGDFLTLFVYWELSAIASAAVVWAGGTPRSSAPACAISRCSSPPGCCSPRAPPCTSPTRARSPSNTSAWARRRGRCSSSPSVSRPRSRCCTTGCRTPTRRRARPARWCCRRSPPSSGSTRSRARSRARSR